MPDSPRPVDPTDPRLAPYRDLRDRDLARDGLLVVEGLVPLDHLLTASRFETVSILVSAAKWPGLTARFGPRLGDTPVLVAAQPVMDAIAGFNLHRGVLALARRRPGEAAPLPATGASRLVAAAGISNTDNMGALFRNAAAFGCDAMVLDAACCDPLYRKAIRVSAGTALSLPFVRLEAGVDMIGYLEGAGYRPLGLSPGAAVALAEFVPAPRTALVVGAEGPGLTAEAMARMNTVSIPMAPGVDSLNVATAAAVALHHLTVMAGRSRAPMSA